MPRKKVPKEPRLDDFYPLRGPYRELKVSRERLAYLLSLQPHTIGQLAAEKLLITESAGVYLQDASIMTYVANLRAVAARHSGGSTGINIIDENALTKRANRQRAEMLRDEAAGRLYSEKMIDEAWQPVARTLRNLVMTAPKLIEAEVPGIKKSDLGKIRKIITDLLRDASVGKLMHEAPQPMISIRSKKAESESDEI